MDWFSLPNALIIWSPNMGTPFWGLIQCIILLGPCEKLAHWDIGKDLIDSFSFPPTYSSTKIDQDFTDIRIS